MPNAKNLINHQWEKGQPGNPNGSSRKARTRKLLREFVATGLQADIPASVAKKLGEHLEGLKVGEALAAELLLRALAGSGRDLDRIIAMEPRAIEEAAAAVLAEAKSPLHLPSPADEAALVESVHEDEQIH